MSSSTTSQKYTRDDIVNQIQMVADELGRPPKRQEFWDHPSTVSNGGATWKFGSWGDALEAAGFGKYRDRQSVSRIDLLRNFNVVSHHVTGVPSWSEVKEYSSHSKRQYQSQFDNHEQVCRLSNVTPPIDHVARALTELYHSGISYVTTRGLREYMYPDGNVSDLTSTLGMDKLQQKEVERIRQEWDYPPMSAARISKLLVDISEREDLRVDLSLWNDAQKNRYRIRMEDNSE